MIDGAAVPLVFDGMIGLVCLWLHWWVMGGSPPMAPPKGSKQRQETNP